MEPNRDFACENCFNDVQLREWIRDNDERDDCHWCGSEDVYVISLEELGPLFREVAAIYEPVTEPDEFLYGDDISLLLQEDWNIFSECIEESADNLMHQLTLDILRLGIEPKDAFDLPDYNQGFHRPYPWLEDRWYQEIEALLSGKELSVYDPLEGPDQSIQVALEDLARDYAKDHLFYRARTHKDRVHQQRFSQDELTAPSPEKTPGGRANRKGEPVLYLASDSDTALAEIRAWRGAAIAVAELKLQRDIRIIDFLKYDMPDSPFFDEYLEWKVQLAIVFHLFGEDLSRPILPNEVDLLYQPSQHLCEIIRKNGYDGVAYPSAMGLGYNIVLFNPSDAIVMGINYLRVVNLSFEVEALRDGEKLYEEWPYQHFIEDNIDTNNSKQ